MVFAFCTDPPGLANNTIRNRFSRCSTFLAWCVREGHVPPKLHADVTGPDSPIRRIPRIYGKQQSKNPPRFLAHAQAYGQLVATCDGTDLGLRDELVLRLGLAGMRANEIRCLNWSNIDLTARHIAWIGKKRRPRLATPGDTLVARLNDWRSRYERAIGRPVTPDDPVLCPTRGRETNMAFGVPIPYAALIRGTVHRRAAQAGLGHVTPHDLRRTAAAILHHAKSADGGHYFDLLDIQRVLGHTDPAVTMKCYLEPLDTGTLDRAAEFLD